ncbi:PAS domain-containing protein [Devosia pacifica]|uniref:PAS domain-containing protein n=1 Tax=Devosia pacifica TaxID=1335967 RepID=A0A918RYE7_9HYPH|nr:PAS domain-containing protein [Devosia pacifica]GHA14004.1 PAS domain-containing protein [Devosia pacifica]
MQKTSSKTLYQYWNLLRGARSAPERRDIDPTAIREALAYTFILEAEETTGYSFRLAGSHLCTAYCRELKGRSFTKLWDERDADAMDTLVRAVTEDHAVALVTFQGTTAVNTRTQFETILLPLRHNGSTHARILGATTALDEPYWLGVQPILEQRITGLRLIWPDDITSDLGSDVDVAANVSGEPPYSVPGMSAIPSQVFGRSARRYAHLSVIDGGRQ